MTKSIDSDRRALRDLLRRYGHFHCLPYPLVDEATAREISADEALRSVGPASAYVSAPVGSSLRGAAWTQPQPFDTQMLGWPAESIAGLVAEGDYIAAQGTKLQLLADLEEDCAGRGVQYLTCRVPAADVASVHALEQRGFLMLDTLLTFSLDSGDAITDSTSTCIRAHREEDGPALRAIAARAFRYDRFHADPDIPPERADALHATWIENSCKGYADAVLVAEGDGVPRGFVTCRLGRRTERLPACLPAGIELIATDPAARGRGIGAALVRGAVRWCAGNGATFVGVSTQARNTSAVRLYQRAGFAYRHASHFFRKHLEVT